MRVVVLVAMLMLAAQAIAQDLVIQNGRIITGTGQLIEEGYVVIRRGRIESVSAGDPPGSTSPVIDASGKTVMPGMINVHWHLTVGSPASNDEELASFVDEVVAGELNALLARGVTTIMTAGDHHPAILGIRERASTGSLPAPRLLVAGPVLTSPGDWPTQICADNEYCRLNLTTELTSVEQAQGKVRELAAEGVDAIKLVYDDRIAPNARIDDKLVLAVAAEARENGLTLYVHISTIEETALSVVDLGGGRLVHPVPLRSDASRGGADRLRSLGVAVSTTVSDLSREWSDLIGREYTEDLEAAFNQRLADIKHLHDAGVVIGFGTDTVAAQGSMSDRRFLAEANSLNRILTNEEVIATLTRDAAIYLELEDELGTLESGKLADVIIIDGDPLTDISALMNVDLVIQLGDVIAADQR